MNKRMIAAMMAMLVLLTMASCKKNDEPETTAAETVAESEIAATETTADPIDVEGIQRETEPDVNKATVIKKEESEESAEQETVKTTEAAEDPSETVAPTVEVHIKGESDYEKLLNMSGTEQKEFMKSFESEDAFFEWLENAKAEYEAENPAIEIGGDGTVDLGKSGN